MASGVAPAVILSVLDPSANAIETMAGTHPLIQSEKLCDVILYPCVCFTKRLHEMVENVMRQKIMCSSILSVRKILQSLSQNMIIISKGIPHC